MTNSKEISLQLSHSQVYESGAACGFSWKDGQLKDGQLSVEPKLIFWS